MRDGGICGLCHDSSQTEPWNTEHRGERVVSFYEDIQLKMVSQHQCTAKFTNFMILI